MVKWLEEKVPNKKNRGRFDYKFGKINLEVKIFVI